MSEFNMAKGNLKDGKVVLYCVSTFDNRMKGWLRSFDVEAYEGRGHAVLCPDRDDALVFEDHAAAFMACMSVPNSRPIRDDGEPNKPLTAFHIEFVPLDDVDPNPQLIAYGDDKEPEPIPALLTRPPVDED